MYWYLPQAAGSGGGADLGEDLGALGLEAGLGSQGGPPAQQGGPAYADGDGQPAQGEAVGDRAGDQEGRPTGPTTRNQAQTRPRTSTRSAPGTISVSQSDVPSSP
jgi:hypothetical protein